MNNDVMSITDIDEGGLSAEETRLLLTLMNPEAAGMSITDKCKMANVSRPFYYSAVRRPHFQEALKRTGLDLVREKLADIVRTSIEVATKSGYRGFADRRLLLTMAGVYSERQDINLIASPGQAPPVSDEEVEAKLAQVMGRYLAETASKGEE